MAKEWILNSANTPLPMFGQQSMTIKSNCYKIKGDIDKCRKNFLVKIISVKM